MTDPSDQDDNWGELYRELGVDDSEVERTSPQTDASAEEVVELTASDFDASVELGEAPEPIEDAPEAEADDADDAEDGDLEPSDAEAGDGAGDGEPGQKKRRRRRRRRKKKGGAAQTGDESAQGEGEEEQDEAESAYEGDADEYAGPAGEEESFPEMTRDIIADWNVPSWEEIVASLHRPDR